MQITFFRRLTLSPEGNRASTLTMGFNWFLFSIIIEVGERKLRFHILIIILKKNAVYLYSADLWMDGWINNHKSVLQFFF